MTKRGEEQHIGAESEPNNTDKYTADKEEVTTQEIIDEVREIKEKVKSWIKTTNKGIQQGYRNMN